MHQPAVDLILFVVYCTSISGVVQQNSLFAAGRTVAHGHIVLTSYSGPVLHKPVHGNNH